MHETAASSQVSAKNCASNPPGSASGPPTDLTAGICADRLYGGVAAPAYSAQLHYACSGSAT